MPNIKPYYQEQMPQGQISVESSPEEFGAGVGQGITNLGRGMENVADAVHNVDEAKSKMRAARFLTQTDLDWRKKMVEMQSDPDFTKKYGEDGSGYSEAIKSGFETFATDAIDKAEPDQKKYIEDGMYTLGSSVLSSSMEYQAKVGSEFAVTTVTQGIANGRESASLSPEQAGSILKNTRAVVNAAPHLDAVQRMKLQREADKEVATGVALGSLNKYGVTAADSLLAGKMTFDVVGEDGKKKSMNVSGMMDGETYKTLLTQAERVKKEAGAEGDINAKNLFSDISLGIKAAQSPDEIVGMQEKINTAETTVGHIKANDLRGQLQGKINDQTKEIDQITTGSSFAAGDLYLNPSNEKQVEAYNKYFNSKVMPDLEAVDPDTRNNYLVNLIDRTKVIPKAVAGDIKATARSSDAKQVARAADFLDRMAQQNPHMLQDFDQSDIARINIVNGFLQSGYNSREAVEMADKKMDTSNATVTARTADLAKQKIDYKSKAVSNFTEYFRGEDTSSDFASRQIDQLTTDYKRSYDSVFTSTGDAALAEKQAAQAVQGMYGVSKINGKNQIMRFPPEKYYSIQNEDNDWMRKQFIDEAHTALSAGMQNPGLTAEKDVFLVPDPKVTPRTAKQGTPMYKMMLKTETGELVPILGPNKYFYFDPEKRRAELTAAAQAKEASKKQARENLMNQPPVIK